MREYKLRMAQYGISREAYNELLAFCRQYPEKKAKAAAIAGVSAQRLTGMPGGGGTSDPVARAAIRRERLLEECGMIEEAARQAQDGAYFDAIMLNCCHRVRYELIDPTILPTAKRNAFFRARREFFWLLWKKRSGEE